MSLPRIYPLSNAPSPRMGILFASGVLLSGAASLINEVVWQRAFQRYLGGSETLSSALVVTSFMLGLGVGSLAAGGYVGRFRRPLAALALVEAGLAGTTLLIAIVADGGTTDAIVEVQLAAVRAGLPVTLVFGCLSGAILFIPCFFMGATMPLASAVCQRTLGRRDSRTLGILFGVNTLGAAAGALAAGYWMVPLFGISSSLHAAVALNIIAAMTFVAAGHGASREDAESELGGRRDGESELFAGWPLRGAAIMMLVLGFCSLGYEMALLRLFALWRGPLPYTFALVITGFLVAWSLGAALSLRASGGSLAAALGACGAGLLLPIASFYLWWYVTGFGIPEMPLVAPIYPLLRRVLTAACFLPCGIFGFLFGAVTARAAQVWGRDVGRLYAANTAGAVAGAMAIPLVGFELPYPALVAVLAGMMVVLRCYEGRVAAAKSPRGRPLPAIVTAVVAAALLVGGWAVSARLNAGVELWFGRAGVLGLNRDGVLYWDGLWHSRLADGESYIGTNNWDLAALSAVSYSGSAIRDVCVIGLGTGITAGVIARLATVRNVDVYEINPDLAGFHRRHPEGTLRALENPKIKLRWRDARTGLRIRDDRYDLIITQPLYLSQAGSTFLNSREFMEIARARLKPGGVLGLYSQGTEAQKRVMRQTAASVFAHGGSFKDGYLLVLSDTRFDLTEEALRRRFQGNREDPLWREVAANPETGSPAAVRSILDGPRLDWSAWGLNLTDDDPLIEYPGILDMRLEWARQAAR